MEKGKGLQVTEQDQINTPTPRTDEAQKEYAYVGNKGAVSSKFARLLEIENQQLQREMREAKEQINTWATRSEAHRQAKELVSQVLGNVQAERDHFKQLAEERWQMCEKLAIILDVLTSEGRPHGGLGRTDYPDGCECDECQNYDSAKTLLALQQQKKDEKV